MPERVHLRFRDEAHDPPPAKRIRLEEQPGKKILYGQFKNLKQDAGVATVAESKRPWDANLKTPRITAPGTSLSAVSQEDVHGRPVNKLREKAVILLEGRQNLPIWPHASSIRAALRNRDVLLLVGETGSGKSTQLPQFLLSEPWCTTQVVDRSALMSSIATSSQPTVSGGSLIPSQRTPSRVPRPGTVKIGGCIAITQPRRVAAVTLARRVAEEMGSTLGNSSPASKVGYSVRFDNCTSPATKIKFLTEGMLLQEMLHDPWLRGYSAVVVDEVHERSVNVDLVLGFLKRMVEGKKEGRGGISLKVVVMSATADVERLKGFFEGPQDVTCTENANIDVNADKRTGSETDDEAWSEWSGLSSSESESIDTKESESNELKDHTRSQSVDLRAKNVGEGTKVVNPGLPLRLAPCVQDKSSEDASHLGEIQTFQSLSICHIEGRQFPVNIFYSPEPVTDFVDAALKTIFQIHYKEPLPGDILVFLTGQEAVESLESLVNEYALGLGPELPKILCLPLFAALPQVAQQKVFQPTPHKTRKVILATNIAETSVTVSGVRYVIDCGKSKIKQFRSRIGLDSLLAKPISKSAAIQRKGRAGREASGQCYRLYTEGDYLALESSNTPEILRCDLSQAILNMKARGVDDILSFHFLDSPPRESMEKALLQLLQLGALDEHGKVSEVGRRIARLPLSAPLGRVLLSAAETEYECLSEVIDIISCLSVENIFLNLTSDESKEQAEAARRSLFRREGDHLTLLMTVQNYGREMADRKSWAAKHFVSHRAMQAVMDVRKQLRAQCEQLGLFRRSISESYSATQALTTERASEILKCFLKGFAWNSARMMPDGSYRTLRGNQTVAIHPSSVLFGRKVEAIMYNEFVFTNKSYARGVSAVQMDWVGHALGVI